MALFKRITAKIGKKNLIKEESKSIDKILDDILPDDKGDDEKDSSIQEDENEATDS